MTAKQNKISLLKQKIYQMQNQLKSLQCKEPIKNPFAAVKQVNAMSPKGRNTSTNKQYKNPTFWGNNLFDSHDEGNWSKRSHSKTPERLERRSNNASLQKSLSPKLQNIIKKVDEGYYIPQPLKDFNKADHQKPQFYSTAYIGKRYQSIQFGSKRDDTPRFSKKKTYPSKKTDLILNPEKQRQGGIKIVNTIQKSPDKMFTDNPRSNPSLYFFGKPVILQKKAAINCNKNKSSINMSASDSLLINNSLQKTRKTSKKHFNKYFIENLFSNIS